MNSAAAALGFGNAQVGVQHFMKHDVPHKIPRHKRLIQERMDAYQFQLMAVAAKPDRSAPPYGGHLPPRNGRFDAPLEMALIHVLKQLLQVKALPPCPHPDTPGPARRLPDPVPVFPDEGVQDPPRLPGFRPADPRRQGVQHPGVRGEEHVMEPHRDAPGDAVRPDRKHIVGVVGQGEIELQSRAPFQRRVQHVRVIPRKLELHEYAILQQCCLQKVTITGRECNPRTRGKVEPRQPHHVG